MDAQCIKRPDLALPQGMQPHCSCVVLVRVLEADNSSSPTPRTTEVEHVQADFANAAAADVVSNPGSSPGGYTYQNVAEVTDLMATISFSPGKCELSNYYFIAIRNVSRSTVVLS